MKNRIRKMMTAGLLGLLLLLTGCRVGNKEIVVSSPLNSHQVFKIGKVSCSLKEAKVYLVNYQNIYGDAYGLDLWQHDFGDDSLVEYVKSITLQELARVVSMDQLAASKEITLDKEQKDVISEAAKEYYDSLTDAERSYMEVSESDIREYYEHYALAQKIYQSLTDAVNEEVSDDEARVMEIMQIYVTDRKKAEEVTARLTQGEDFATVANNYNELDSIQVNVSRDDLPKEAADVIFEMENEQVSGRIEVDGGYYFVKCLNKYDKDLTEANKTRILEKREKEAFDGEYSEFTASLDSGINQKLWDELEIKTGSDMKTNTFFETFEKYCGDM